MERQDELFDEVSLRRAWHIAGVDVAGWDVESALAEARRLAAVVGKLRSLDDRLLGGQLKSTSSEDFDELLRESQ